MSLLVIGSVALDSVATPFGSVEEALGGSATYFSCSASFFTTVKLVAVVGEDFPSRHIRFLKTRNIDLKGLQVKKGRTFRWKGSYEYDLNEAKTVYTHLNVFSNFKPHIPEEYKDEKFVFLANIDPDLQADVLKQVRKPALVACDSMNFWIENKRKELIRLLKKVDIFILNDAEARELAEEPNLLKGARRILSFGPRMVIIKKGEHGALLFSDHSSFSAPAYPLESIYDPTGAGDTFAGGFMGYLSRAGKANESTVRKAIIYGSVMASYNVEDFSLNRLRRLTLKDIDKRYREFKKLTCF